MLVQSEIGGKKRVDHKIRGRLSPADKLLHIEDAPMKTLDVVALTNDIPEKYLRRGQVGTIVEPLAANMFEVEFSDLEGNPYEICAVPEDNLMVLHHAPEAMAA